MIPRTKPLKRSPLKRKCRKKTDDPKYLAWIRTLSCLLFANDTCDGVIEAHHAGDHGFGQRAPDRTAIPLCARHHRLSTISVHVMGKNFWDFHDIDRDTIITLLNAAYKDGL